MEIINNIIIIIINNNIRSNLGVDIFDLKNLL